MTFLPKHRAGKSFQHGHMLDRPMTIERLLAHAVIFQQAALRYGDERVAGELRSLAEHCVRAALAGQ